MGPTISAAPATPTTVVALSPPIVPLSASSTTFVVVGATPSNTTAVAFTATNCSVPSWRAPATYGNVRFANGLDSLRARAACGSGYGAFLGQLADGRVNRRRQRTQKLGMRVGAQVDLKAVCTGLSRFTLQQFAAPGTYRVCYSTDGGATWVLQTNPTAVLTVQGWRAGSPGFPSGLTCSLKRAACMVLRAQSRPRTPPRAAWPPAKRVRPPLLR